MILRFGRLQIDVFFQPWVFYSIRNHQLEKVESLHNFPLIWIDPTITGGREHEANQITKEINEITKDRWALKKRNKTVDLFFYRGIILSSFIIII